MALEEDSKAYKVLSNRSAAHAELENFEAALADANDVIALAPEWPKGYLRKGKAEAGTTPTQSYCLIMSNFAQRITVAKLVNCISLSVVSLTCFLWFNLTGF